jgi:lipopolysaccharide export system ATP-binding protein
MSAQRAAGPARLAAVIAAVALVALTASVAVRLIGRRDAVRTAAPAPPPRGRVVDRKERVRHQEFREGRLVAEVCGDTFSLGPDGRNHIQGSVEVVHYGPGGEIGSRLTAEEVVYDKGALVFTVTGRVRIEAGGVVLEGDTFVYDQAKGMFSTLFGGVFSSRALKGRAKGIAYAEGSEEVRLGGGFRLETGSTGPAAEPLTVSGEALTYARRQRRGRIEGGARLEGGGLRGSAAAASIVALEDETGLVSAVLEGEAEVVLDGKEPRADRSLEARADRIALAFPREASRIALEISGHARFDLRSPSDRSVNVLAPSAVLHYSRDDGCLTWQAWGGVRVQAAEGEIGRALEGEEAGFDSNDNLGVRGKTGRPASAESADFRFEAAHIIVHSVADDVLATGGVSGVLKGGEERRRAGFFSPGADVAFSCRGLEFRSGISTFLFTGDVVARQGEGAVRAEELETIGEAGRMSGRGGVEIALTAAAENGSPVRTIVMGGEEMSYRPDTRALSLAGKAFVQLPEARLEAGRCSAVIGREGQSIESLAAEAGVTVSKGDYLGRAEAAVYQAGEDRIVLSGSPVLTDGQGGSARGDKLTFDLADDKILVENEGSARSATVIRSREMKGSLRAVGLEKSYGRKKVVDGVSVRVDEGEIVGLLGPNGAGKTTTFSMIVGLVPQDGGRVFLRDEDITDRPMFLRARKGLVLLPQEPSSFRKLTVAENLLAVLETRMPGPAARAARAEAALEEFGLEKLAGARALTLSGGERRRLEIARAMVMDPDFLLLDEPFTGIDPLSVRELQEVIRGLRGKGLGVLLTDHSVREALAITDRAYILEGGRVLKEGRPEEIVTSEEVRKSYLGDEFRL